MRVSVGSLTVTGPSAGSVNESNATGTSNGRFYGVVTGVARPFREAGIQAPDPAPSGSIPPIPRWDFNPERLRIESATIDGQPVLTVKSGDVVGPLAGPLDYSSRGYALLPMARARRSSRPARWRRRSRARRATSSRSPRSTSSASSTPSTIAHGDAVLTLAAYDRRLAQGLARDPHSPAQPGHHRRAGGRDARGPDRPGRAGSLRTADRTTTRTSWRGTIRRPGRRLPGEDDSGHRRRARVSAVSVTQVGGATTWLDPVDNQPACSTIGRRSCSRRPSIPRRPRASRSWSSSPIWRGERDR